MMAIHWAIGVLVVVAVVSLAAVLVDWIISDGPNDAVRDASNRLKGEGEADG